MRVAVTGIAGFIGSHVGDAFAARGDEVLGIDDLSTGLEQNVPDAARFERLDVADSPGLTRALAEFHPELVCHLAAQASVTVSVNEPERDFTANVLGTFNVCEEARRHGASVVFASTGGALYGDDAPIPTREDFPPAPLSPYGAGKLAAEAYVATWGRANGLPNVVLRLGNVYGPRQNPHGEAGVVAIFSELLGRGERPTVYGHGKPTRDYVFVRDVAAAFVSSADAGLSATFNVGHGREVSVDELLDELQRVAGTDLEPIYEDLRPGELRRSALDASALEQATGWRPEVDLADGVAETYRWYASERGDNAVEAGS